MGRIMMNGIQYGTGGRPTAEGVTYDNAESGMTATNVQGALDELSNGLTDLILFKQYTGSGKSTTKENQSAWTLPITEYAGYTPVLVIFKDGHDSCFTMNYWQINSDMKSIYFCISNMHTSTKTITPDVVVMYVKTGSFINK